jgi:hypothetical protein
MVKVLAFNSSTRNITTGVRFAMKQPLPILEGMGIL